MSAAGLRLPATRLGAAGLLLLLCLSFLPGLFTIPPLDRDESRFAQASRQMLESGDFIDIRFQDEPRHKKPVLIYWMQSAAAAVAGGPDSPIWAFRLPSLIGAVAGVFLAFWAGRPLVGARAAALGAAMVALTAILQGEARVAKTDAMLFAAATAAFGALAHIRFGISKGWSAPFILWTALAAGVLLKGPLILLPVAGVAILMSFRDRSPAWLRDTRPLPGMFWFLALALPWFVAIMVKTGGAFLDASLGDDLVRKVGEGMESHGAPPGTYFAIFWVGFWPATGFAVLAAPWVLRNWRKPEVFFLLAWILPFWLLLELTPTKLPHYPLPLYGAIALLAAAGVLEAVRLPGWLLALASILWAIPTLVLTGISVGLPLYFDSIINVLDVVLAATSLLAAIVALVALARRNLARSGLFGALAAVVTWAALFGVALPGLKAPFLSRSLADAEARCGIPREAVTAVAGYHEPSAVFLLGTETALASPEEARALYASGSPVWVTSKALPSVFDAPPPPQTEISGFNYNGKGETRIGLYSTTPLDCG